VPLPLNLIVILMQRKNFGKLEREQEVLALFVCGKEADLGTEEGDLRILVVGASSDPTAEGRGRARACQRFVRCASL